MVIASYILPEGNNERLVVEQTTPNRARLEHRYADYGVPGVTLIEEGGECEMLLLFADMVQEQVFTRMPCATCEECVPSDETSVPEEEAVVTNSFETPSWDPR